MKDIGTMTIAEFKEHLRQLKEKNLSVDKNISKMRRPTEFLSSSVQRTMQRRRTK